MFTVNESFDVDDHEFRTLKPHRKNWRNELANRYCSLRSQPVAPLNEEVFEGLSFDVSRLRTLAVRASIPKRTHGSPLCIVRSDFGEVVAVALFEAMYGTRFGWIGIRDRATAGLPGAGIDSVGVEGDEKSLSLVLLEVKVTAVSRNNKPPEVVDSKDDSLWKQHLRHVQQREAGTLGKVVRAADAARDERTRSLLMLAAVSLTTEAAEVPLQIVCASVLVRPQSKFRPHDFGKFRTAPDDLCPAKIRFLAPLVADDLEGEVDDWYAQVVAAAGGEG